MPLVYKFVLLALLTLLSVLWCLNLGVGDTSLGAMLTCITSQCATPLEASLFWDIRLPRVMAALLVGLGLACAGAILQNTTRNALADPYLFGIMAGAGLGASLIGLRPDWGVPLYLGAFCGSAVAIALVIGIAKLARQPQSLLLIGIAVAFMCSAVTHFVLYISDPLAANRVIFWLMGSLSRVELSHLSLLAPVVALSLTLVVGYARQLDALLLGDESAQTLGVNVAKLRFIMLALCAAITASVVSYCGGIGFVGLMIPHIARALFGITTLPLIAGSGLLGALFLLWVDTLARTALNGQELPLGVITSALGSVFFLIIIVRKPGKIRL